MKFNCDDVTERLPWLLNGTLGDEESAAVREHLSQCASCRRALEETRLAWETFDQHPPTEEIVALAWGETSNAALEEHLESCPRCTAELELARMSRRLEEDERILPIQTKPVPARRTRTETAPAATGGWRGWRNAAVAASLAGVVGLTGWMHSANRVQNLEEQIAARPAPPAATAPSPSPAPLAGAGAPSPSTEEGERARQLEQQRQELEALRTQEQELRARVDQLASALPAAPQPQINPTDVNLEPIGDVMRSPQGETAKEMPAGSPAVLYLEATHEETQTHSGHAVAIEDAAGKVVWRSEGLVRDAKGDNYGIALPAGTLRPGDYTIRVYGLNGGQREPAETYALRVKG